VTARQAGAHRRNAGPPAAAPIRELRRCRVEVAELAAELAAVTAERDELRALVVEMAGGESHDWCRVAVERARVEGDTDGYRRGREDESRELDRAWHEAADPLARGGPAWAQLEILRWGPAGRARFADPRPTDYRGGAVAMWDAPAGQGAA
jgi:hypothetical protein